MPTIAKAPFQVPHRPAFSLVSWLIKLDRNYRNKQKMNSLDAHLLKDMGLTREDVDKAFLGRFGSNRWTPGER